LYGAAEWKTLLINQSIVVFLQKVNLEIAACLTKVSRQLLGSVFRMMFPVCQ
jgi:hypothetical protein